MYLLRFDDVCPTMNWTVWTEIDEILTINNIKPILAVIPDNKKREFFIERENSSFWDYIRERQRQGWSIGLHGYQHVGVTRNPGIIKMCPCSEFAGLPEEEQEAKISKAIEIFKANGVKPDLWVAPWHSFDHVTIKVLKRHGITIISDGFSLYPYVDGGMLWVPRQLSGFRRLRRPFGVYTVLFHHNSWTKRDLLTFRRDVERYRAWIADLKTVISLYSSRRKSFLDVLHSIWLQGIYIKYRLRAAGLKSIYHGV
jgi:predicted deacetylase